MSLNKKLNFADCAPNFAWDRVASSVLIALLSTSGQAFAAPSIQDTLKTVPDAGRILQEIERNLEAKPLPEAPPVEVAPEEEAQGEKVLIKQFNFEGNTALNTADLQEALSSLTGHEITVTKLKTCVDLISAYYRQKGFLATASLPEQDITEGVVVIKIVEATFGGVKFNGEYGKDFKRVKPSVIKRVIDGGMEKGRVLNQTELDRALAITQTMSGFKLSANFQAGEKENTTDVLVSVKDKPLLSGSLIADNTGGRSTGRHKQTATLALASPFGFGDALNFVALHSEGTDYVNASYKLPVLSKGLQIGANASYLMYDVILKDEAIAGIKPKGSSSTIGVDVIYPILISSKANLNLELNYDRKTFLNQIKPEAVYLKSSDYTVNVFSAELNGRLNDQFLAGAVNSAYINLGRGNVDLSGSGNIPGKTHQETDAEGANTQGYYNRIKWSLGRTQFINDTISLSLDATGQMADKNLDSSEKLYLGGSNGVRAYPTSEGGGSEGYLLKLELRKYLPNNFVVSAFMDDGYIKQYKTNAKNGGTNAGETLTATNSPNEYYLKGYGASVAWSGPYNSTVKATYAHRIGKNPNPSVTDTGGVHDQDGVLRTNIFWLSGSVAF